jgi:hypothetical protein
LEVEWGKRGSRAMERAMRGKQRDSGPVDGKDLGWRVRKEDRMMGAQKREIQRPVDYIHLIRSVFPSGVPPRRGPESWPGSSPSPLLFPPSQLGATPPSPTPPRSLTPHLFSSLSSFFMRARSSALLPINPTLFPFLTLFSTLTFTPFPHPCLPLLHPNRGAQRGSLAARPPVDRLFLPPTNHFGPTTTQCDRDCRTELTAYLTGSLNNFYSIPVSAESRACITACDCRGPKCSGGRPSQPSIPHPVACKG